MVDNLEYARLWTISAIQRVYDQPDAFFTSTLDSLALGLNELRSAGSRLEDLVSHFSSSPGVIIEYYQSWFGPYVVAGVKVVAEILPTSAQISFITNRLQSILGSILDYTQPISSSAMSLARNVANDHRFQLPDCLDTMVRLVVAHPLVALLGSACLLLELAGAALLVWFVRTPQDRLLGYMGLDRNCIVRELARMADPRYGNVLELIVYFASEYSWRSNNDAEDLPDRDAFSNAGDDSGRDYDRPDYDNGREDWRRWHNSFEEYIDDLFPSPSSVAPGG